MDSIEAKFSHLFHKDLPPPLQRRVTKFVYPNSSVVVKDPSPAVSPSLRRRDRAVSALRHFASDIIILTATTKPKMRQELNLPVSMNTSVSPLGSPKRQKSPKCGRSPNIQESLKIEEPLKCPPMPPNPSLSLNASMCQCPSISQNLDIPSNLSMGQNLYISQNLSASQNLQNSSLTYNPSMTQNYSMFQNTVNSQKHVMFQSFCKQQGPPILQNTTKQEVLVSQNLSIDNEVQDKCVPNGGCISGGVITDVHEGHVHRVNDGVMSATLKDTSRKDDQMHEYEDVDVSIDNKISFELGCNISSQLETVEHVYEDFEVSVLTKKNTECIHQASVQAKSDDIKEPLQAAAVILDEHHQQRFFCSNKGKVNKQLLERRNRPPIPCKPKGKKCQHPAETGKCLCDTDLSHHRSHNLRTKVAPHIANTSMSQHIPISPSPSVYPSLQDSSVPPNPSEAQTLSIPQNTSIIQSHTKLQNPSNTQRSSMVENSTVPQEHSVHLNNRTTAEGREELTSRSNLANSSNLHIGARFKHLSRYRASSCGLPTSTKWQYINQPKEVLRRQKSRSLSPSPSPSLLSSRTSRREKFEKSDALKTSRKNLFPKRRPSLKLSLSVPLLCVKSVGDKKQRAHKTHKGKMFSSQVPSSTGTTKQLSSSSSDRITPRAQSVSPTPRCKGTVHVLGTAMDVVYRQENDTKRERISRISTSRTSDSSSLL